MKRYANTTRTSGIDSYRVGDYENGELWIEVIYKAKMGKVYRYEPPNKNLAIIKEAEKLAEAGSGLNSYLKRYMTLKV